MVKMTMNKKLSLKNIKKSFTTKDGELVAIDDISLDLYEGEILAVVGTSGCGKSTLLNIISGLDSKSAGIIDFGKDDPKVSYMLQSDALLPWRTVLDNATLGLELAHMKTEENTKKIEELLKNYGLGEFLNNYPDSLSGGMRQRVALIRSLAIDPDILLLDEPFSALDYYTRLTISKDVHDMIKDSGKTAIIITHDIQEALSVADRVVVLSCRPSTVKAVYTVPFSNSLDVLSKRYDPKFEDLYKKIWGDLDDEI